MSALSKFLERNSAAMGKPLPLVHSTRAYFLKNILETNKIASSRCDVFRENLSYFFVGRPSYKWNSDGDATEWELPICFIFDYDIENARRIFPFDSGGYDRYPKYLNFIDRDEFNMISASRAPERFIGAFFASPRDYFFMKPRAEHKFNDEFLVDVFDAEVKAVHKMAMTASPGADDRRCSIEVQFSEAIEFHKRKPIGLIAPDIYLENKMVKNFIKTKNISYYGYSTYSLNCAAYYSQIYNYVKLFYEKKGFLNV